MAAGSFVKDWLPAILGGVVGAADPQTGDALTQTITKAQAAKKRRLDEQRQRLTELLKRLSGGLLGLAQPGRAGAGT